MHLTKKKTIYIFVLLLVASVTVIIGALQYGATQVPFSNSMSILANTIGFRLHFNKALPESTILIIRDIRLKRILLGFLVGMALSVSGCIFQALLRNPLADPHILGASSGGALGAVLASACGIPLILKGIVTIPLFSFLGSLGAISIVYILSKRKGALSVYSLILVGVILNSFFISIVIFIETIVSADQLASIFFWLLGSLTHVNNTLMKVIACIICVGIFILFFETRNINLMTLGEERARSLGVSVERTKRICFIIASVITGLSVAVSGLIGFVGLVVPHMGRLIFGSDHRVLLPASALMGGMFLVIADTIARTVLLPQELPVGVVTSFIGAPFFIFLLKRREGKRIF